MLSDNYYNHDDYNHGINNEDDTSIHVNHKEMVALIDLHICS